MDRSPRHRRLLAVTVAGGVLAAAAGPHVVAAGPAPAVWPVDLHPIVLDAGASSVLASSDPPAMIAPEHSTVLVDEPAASSRPEIHEEAPGVNPESDVPDVPEVPDPEVTEPAAEVAPAPAAPAAPVEQTAAADVIVDGREEAASVGGTLTVHAVSVDGADRYVSVRPVAGGAGLGPLTVGQDTIVLDLPAGTYDLLVEQVAHGGGAFAARARFTMDPGGQVAATCDPDTLDCAVVA